MRVTTNLIFNQNLRAINVSQGQLSDVQSQLASGKRILRPSDDSVGASQVIRITERLDKINQYQRNIDLASSNLELQETALRSINESVNRARVLAVQSGNGIFSQADRNAVATEVEQIRNQVIDLMNTRNPSGDYIFSGYQSQQQAFEFNPNNTANPIEFKGDDGANRVQISDSVTVQSTSSGKELFENVNARLNFTELAGASAVLEEYEITSQNTFDVFHKSNFDPASSLNSQLTFTITAANEISVTSTANGSLLDTVAFSTGESFNYQGIDLNINGGVGDAVTIELNRPTKQNIAETLHNFSLGLKDESINSQSFSSMLADTLVGIDNALGKMARETSSIGSRLNIADAVRSSLLDSEVINQQARSSIQDVDYAQASSDFARQETALEAAFASFPRVANLSLFNFI